MTSSSSRLSKVSCEASLSGPNKNINLLVFVLIRCYDPRSWGSSAKRAAMGVLLFNRRFPALLLRCRGCWDLLPPPLRLPTATGQDTAPHGLRTVWAELPAASTSAKRAAMGVLLFNRRFPALLLRCRGCWELCPYCSKSMGIPSYAGRSAYYPRI
jgi:hypothetical protein